MRTSILRSFALVLLVVGVMLSTGCGLGGDSSSTSTTNNNHNNTTPPITHDPTPTIPVDPDPVTPTAPVVGVVHSIYTDEATYLSDTAATLNGRLDVTWASSAEYAYYQIRQSGYGWGGEIMVGRPGIGSVPPKAIAGLTPSSDYDVQLVARTGTNSQTYGGIRSFRTLATPPVTSGELTPTVPVDPTPTTPTIPNPDPVTPTAPTTPTPGGPVVTGNASDIGSNSVTLNGSVNGISWANGGAAYFLVSPNKARPWIAQIVGQPIGNVSTTVANLLDNSDYWARLITITGVGEPIKGEWVPFRTLAYAQAGTSPTFQPSTKALTTGSMPRMNQADSQTRGYVNLTTDGATVLGYVYCNNEVGVQVWFQCSMDGENWGNYFVGTWDKDDAVKYPIYGLSSMTTYKYRLAIGSSEESLRYGDGLKFTTLGASDSHDSFTENANGHIANMGYQVVIVKSMCEGSYMGDDGFVSSVSDVMDQANDNEYFAWYFMNTPELAGAVSSVTAQNFIDTDKRLTEVRTQFGTLLERAMNASWGLGTPTISAQAGSFKASSGMNSEGITKKAFELAGTGDITFASAPEAPDNMPPPYINRGYFYLKVVNALIDGCEASKQIINNLRWNTNLSDYWGTRYITNMTFRSYLAVVVINQFIALPEVRRSLDTATKIRLEQMKTDMKFFRRSMRRFENDCLSARQEQSGVYQDDVVRYTTGQ